MNDDRVLVIANESRICRKTSAALRRAGYGVLHAESGSRGVQTAISEQPDAIVLDLRMRRGTGELALGFLRRSFRTSHIPVVVLDDREKPRGAAKTPAAASVRRTPLEPLRIIEEIDAEITKVMRV